jgi:S1-C subfamily serine protease
MKCRGHGSAFYIGNDYFLTAGHVGEAEDELILKRQDGRIIKAETVWVAVHSDWSLLKAEKPVANMEALTLTCKEPKVDDKVYTIGNPASLNFIKTHGTVAAFQETIEGYDGENIYVTDMTTYFGNSGGPVFNDKGEVWGNLVAGLQGTALSIVEPVSKICDILPKVIKTVD